MKKLAIFLPVLLVLAAILFYIVWMPLPTTPARDAIGTEKAISRTGGEAGERALAYYVAGAGKPVILHASAGREASDFNELASALHEAGYRTIAIEAHGIKRSDLPEGDFSLMDIADDIAAVAEEELKPQEQAAVIGHAFGNRAVRAFASRHDDRVSSVVLIASGGAKPIPARARRALFAIFDPRRTVSQRTADIDYGFFAEGNEIPDYWIVGWHTDTAMMQARATGADNYEDWGDGGNNPMLVLQAAEDTIAPPQDAGIPLAKAYPDRVKLVMIARAGHALLPEQPGVIAEEIIAFLADN